MTVMTSATVSPQRFEELVDRVAHAIQSSSEFQPNAILALSTGGFPVAAALAKRLRISSRHVVGIPAYKDQSGDYHFDDRIAELRRCDDLTFLVVDDASNRGLLTKKAIAAIETKGGSARSCVLIASEGGILPDYVGETCPGAPPKFFWEPPRLLTSEAVS